MKNKKLLYILIPGVLLVWGMIFYKIFKNINVEERISTTQTELKLKEENMNVSDTFSIALNYRDPFLGKMNTIVQKRETTVKPVVPKQIKTATPWPTIVYGGVIKNQKSNKQLALVQINGQGYTMKQGEIINDVQLNKIFRDSIEVKFQKEKKFVLK